jgi:hypothetical protein
MPEQQMSQEELERQTNEAFGVTSEPQQPTTDSQQPPSEPASAEPGQSASAATPPAQAPEDFSKFLSETPFKNVEETVKGWKNASGELTRRIQKMKPYEDILNNAESDPGYAEYLRQAHQQYLAYKANPLAFQQPQQNVDLMTPEGIQAYITQQTQQTEARLRMQYQQEINRVQQQAHMENMKAAFKLKYPDANPDELPTLWESITREANPFEVAWKLANYDKMASEATSKARKEVNNQIETAQKTKTPAATPSSQAAKAEDILDHIVKYGSEAAKKRFGEKQTMEALQKATEFYV